MDKAASYVPPGSSQQGLGATHPASPSQADAEYREPVAVDDEGTEEEWDTTEMRAFDPQLVPPTRTATFFTVHAAF